MKTTSGIEPIAMKELESILRRAQTGPLNEQDCAKIKAVFESYLHLTQMVEDKEMMETCTEL
jgi:hypothetical protein